VPALSKVSRFAIELSIKTMAQEGLELLLVEDDEVDIMNVRRVLKQKQITLPLSIARDGLEALEMLRNTVRGGLHASQNRQLVLLDLNMPRMNGIEFLKRLRQDPDLRPTPVVILSTSDDENDRKQAYQYNAAGYLLKATTFKQFAESIEALTRYWSLCKMP
jgi:hypothetical protein